MKNGFLCLTAILTALLLTACGSSGSNLLSQADPESSALSLYCYDGETVVCRTVYDTAQEQEILDELNGLRAKKLDSEALADWSLPCYGLWITDQDGDDLWVAWSDGVWLDQDGGVWQVDVEFETLWQSLEGEDEEDGLTQLSFPNAGLLSACDRRFLLQVEEVEPGTPDDDGIADLPLEMYLTVTDVTDGVATVVINNQSGYVMTYGTYYTLQMELDGSWYELPVMDTGVGFEDIAYELADGQQVTETCDLTIYGDLEPGHYRLVKDGMTAEFDLS